MDKLNNFIGKVVTDPGAAVPTGMVVIGEELGLYQALAQGPMSSPNWLPRRRPMSATFASG
jgi:hypothetical protein